MCGRACVVRRDARQGQERDESGTLDVQVHATSRTGTQTHTTHMELKRASHATHPCSLYHRKAAGAFTGANEVSCTHGEASRHSARRAAAMACMCPHFYASAYACRSPLHVAWVGMHVTCMVASHRAAEACGSVSNVLGKFDPICALIQYACTGVGAGTRIDVTCMPSTKPA